MTPSATPTPPRRRRGAGNRGPRGTSRPIADRPSLEGSSPIPSSSRTTDRRGDKRDIDRHPSRGSDLCPPARRRNLRSGGRCRPPVRSALCQPGFRDRDDSGPAAGSRKLSNTVVTSAPRPTPARATAPARRYYGPRREAPHSGADPSLPMLLCSARLALRALCTSSPGACNAARALRPNGGRGGGLSGNRCGKGPPA